jgi:hypothetical protein
LAGLVAARIRRAFGVILEMGSQSLHAAIVS